MVVVVDSEATTVEMTGDLVHPLAVEEASEETTTVVMTGALELLL